MVSLFRNAHHDAMPRTRQKAWEPVLPHARPSTATQVPAGGADPSGAAARATRRDAEIPTRVLLRCVLGLLVAVALAQWSYAAIDMLKTPTSVQNGTVDFSTFYAAALALRDNPHANIYDVDVLRAAVSAHQACRLSNQPAYLYPPLLAIALVPLTVVSCATAARVWLVGNLLLWLLSTLLLASWLRWALRGENGPSGERKVAPCRMALGTRLRLVWRGVSDTDLFALALATFIALNDWPLRHGVEYGQTSMLILFLVLLGPWLARRRRTVLAGGVLALAALIKVYPLLLIGYFAVRGRWRIVMGALVWLLALTAGMLLVVGVPGVLAMRTILTAGTLNAGQFHNESLARAPLWIAVEVGGGRDTVSPQVGSLLLALVALAWVGGMLVTWQHGRMAARRRAAEQRRGADEADLLGYCWTVCTMVLISPLTWAHYYAWLLPALVYCLGYSIRRLAGGIRAASGRVKPESFALVAVIAVYALTMGPAPLGFDLASTFFVGPQILHVPLRPLFALLRPVSTLLLWATTGLLFWHAQMVAPAPGAPAAATSDNQAPATVAVTSRHLPTAG